MSTRLSMSEASASTGLSPDTLRYYEDIGIIGPFDRDTSNRRTFTSTDIAWIGVITCMREAGLGISDLRTFAEILRDSDAPADPTTFLRGRRTALAARADALARAITVLDEKIDHFTHASATGDEHDLHPTRHEPQPALPLATGSPGTTSRRRSQG